MTENEWLACTDPAAMLEFLKGKASERKLRLFALACCRELDPESVTSEPTRTAVEVAERYMDGVACPEELEAASRAAAAASFAPWVKSLQERRVTNRSEQREGWLARMARWASDTRIAEAAMRAA